MKIKTFILTFLMMMSCSILFGQELLTGEAKSESQFKRFLFNYDYGTITIEDDFSVSSTIEIPKGRKITIDLNGHKLTTNADIYIFKNFGQLTITDNSTDGKGTISSLGIYNGKPQTRTNTDDIDYTAQLTIKGGVFENISQDGGAAIYNHLGVIDIQGGEFYGEYSAITNFGLATIANAYIECLNRDNGAAAIINDFEIEYKDNVNVVGRYTAYSETASITDGEATYLFAELKGTKYPSLQKALDDCTTGDNTINLLFHNSDDATVIQKEGVNITIDGNGYKNKQFEYTDTIYVNGNNRHTGAETLTIQDIDFTTEKDSHDFISANVAKQYAHNVTVQNCNFTATKESTAVVATRFRQSYNINVKDCVFTNLHSAMWATGTSGIAFDNIKATNCKEGGISVATSSPVSVKNSTIEGAQYGVRADGSGAYSLTVENSNLTAEVPVVVRNTTGEYNLTVENDATLTATNNGPQVVVTKGGDNAPYETPTSDVNVTLYDNVTSTFGLTAKIGNAFYATLQDAIDKAKDGDEIVLVSDVTEDVKITQKADLDLVINGDNKTFTGVMTVFGDARHDGNETLTIKDINFVAKNGSDACILSPDRTAQNPARYSYSHNVTVENCSFTDVDGNVNCAAIRHNDGGDVNWTLNKCAVDNTMHSLIQTNNVNGKLVIAECIVNSKNGVNLNSCTNVEMTGCNFDVQGYALRSGVNSGGNLGTEKTFVLEGNTLKSACGDGDAVIMFRASSVDANFSMEKNVVSGTTHISGNTSATKINADENYWDGKDAPVATTPIVVNSYYSDATLTNLVRIPMGDNFTAYTREDAIWGEVGGNAVESFVIKVLDADGIVMGTTTLNNVGGIIDGSVYVTWNIKLDAASNTDNYWTMSWTTAPNINNMPAKVELWVDGVKVSGGDVVLNAPDNLKKINAANIDADGKILAYRQTLENAVNNGDNVAILVAGTYTGENLTITGAGKNLTITGAVDGVVFDNIGAYNMGGANVTFNNVTFDYYPNGDYTGLQHSGNLVYNNCTINGQVFLYGTSETFNNCTFNQNSSDAYNVWTYGAKEVAFNECTFNSAGKSVLIYSEDKNLFNDVAVTKCIFKATSSVEGKAAIEMDSQYTAGINLTIDDKTTAEGFDNGNVSGNSLWNNKKGASGDNNDITVTVAGEVVLQPEFEAQIGETKYEFLSEAIAAVGEGDVVIELLKDATLDYNAREAYGKAETTSLTINGNSKTLTLNQKNSDWSSFGLANADAKVVFNNMIIEKTGYGDTSGAWNTHTIIFSSNVEMNDVTVNNSMAVQNGATLNNVTINEANGYYGLWINGNGQSVTMNGGSITATNGGRGIKIADEYVNDIKQVTLSVTGTTFNTAKKAAVLVSSTAGAKVTAKGCDITKVAADNTNFVWVDEEWAAYYNNIKVSDEATKTQENEESFPIKVWYVNGEGVQSSVRAYYKNLDDLFAAPATQVPGSNYIDLRDNVVANNMVDVNYGSNRVYTFGTSVEGGVTMEFRYDESWNKLPKFDLGKNITMEVPYLQVIGGDISIAGTLNTGYLYLYGTGEGVVIEGTGVVNANVSNDKTVQVKGGTVLTVKGELNTTTLNVWTDDANNSELIVSGDNAEVNAATIHAWNGKDGVSSQKITVEDGAKLTATSLQADRGSVINLNNATIVAPITLGYGDNVGTLVEIGNSTVEGNININSTTSTVTSDGGLENSVSTNKEGYMVVLEDGVYRIAQIVAKIGKTNYASLQDATNAAKSGDVIELCTIASMNKDVTAQIPAGVTIKSNGFSIDGSIRMLGDLTLDGALTINGGLYVGKTEGTLDATLAGDKLAANYFMFQRGSYNINADIDAVYGYLSYEATFEVNSTITTTNTNGEPLWINGNVNLNNEANLTAKNIWLNNENTVLNVKEGAFVIVSEKVNVANSGAELYSTGNISGLIDNSSNGTIVISGGVYTNPIQQDWCADGFIPKDNGDGTYGVEEGLAGDGTATEPYIINSLIDLKYFRDAVNAGDTYAGKTVVLAADINLAEGQTRSTESNWIPIGTDKNHAFKGTFDGGNYTISNLKIYDVELEYAGFFGYTTNATIKNVKVHNVDINAYSHVGAIAGIVYTGNVDNCHVSGTINLVSQYAYAAGITGHGYVTVKNSSVIAEGTGIIKVVEKTGAGGITGWRGEGNTGIYNCIVKNLNITAWSNVGGITGFLHYENTIDNCVVDNVNLYKTREDGQASIGLAAGGWAAKADNVYTITVKNTNFSNMSINGTAINSFKQNGERLIGSNYSYYINIPAEKLVVEENVFGENITDNLSIVVNSEAHLGYALASDEGEVINIGNDIVLEEVDGNGVLVGLKIEGNRIIDLNGFTISGTDNATGSFGLINIQPNAELTINDSSEPSTGKITLTATNNRGWNAYSSVISNQRGKLTVNGGTIEHLGGTDMAYAIDNLTNTGNQIAETIVNGGIIKSTYRAIRQFLNSTAEGVNNILTINGGTIEGANKSIWMQDTNANANPGTLTVGENAQLKGDVYLYVTEGSTSWPVEVSIAAAALAEGSEVISANVPAGYEVKEMNYVYGVYHGVAKIDDVLYESLADAATAAQDGETIQLLWQKGQAPIAMNASLYGKNVTITGTATVDWSKGWLFVGRGGEGDATLTFDNASLTSASTNVNSGFGIHVSGREKNTDNKYDGTLVIKNSTIELDYLIDRGAITIDNATLTVKNGFGIAGRPASETEDNKPATATISLINGAELIVNNHNGMGVGQAASELEGYGIMNIDATSTFKTTQSFLVTANGTMNVNGGNVKVAGTLTNNGTVYVTGEANLDATVTGNGWFYMNGVTLDADTKLLGAKVRFASGTNNIDGSTIDDGFFQVGIGAYNGTDANVDTENDVVVNVKNAHIGANGNAYAGWAGTGFYDTDDEKAKVMTAAKYVLNIENSIAEFGYLHISNDGELNVKGDATEKVWYNNSDYSFYAGEIIINGTATFDATDVLALYTKVSCDNGTDNPGTLNIVNGTEYEAERHNGTTAGTNFTLYKTAVVNADANLHVGEYASIAADAKLNIGGTATILGTVTNDGTINLTDLNAKFTAQEGLTVNNGVVGNTEYGVTYLEGAYQFAKYVAQIGDEKYLTLKEAIYDVEDNGTITLLANETFTENNRTTNSNWYEGIYYQGDKSFTIDLAGYIIGQNGSVNDYLLLFKNEGEKDNTITLKNGTIDAGTAAYCALATASSNTNKMTINTENITFVGNNSDGAVLKIRGGAELNVNEGTIITGKDNYVGIEAAGDNTVVNINANTEIYQKGTSSYVGSLVGASYNATVNVYGGKGTSAKGGFIVMSTGGTINVSGGEWIANNDGTSSNENNAVLISQNNRYESEWASKSVLNVTGGTFKGGYNCYGHADALGFESDDAQINITGGNFNADPTNYVEENYVVKVEADNTYSVVEDQVAKIGDVTYNTLQKAFDAAQDGDEIVVLKEIVLTAGVTVAADKVVVLDLNGKTISMQDASGKAAYAIKNNGNLTIKDSAEGGKITFNSTTPDNSFGYATSTIGNGGHLTIENGLIENTTVGGASYAIDGIWHTGEASLTINDGTITATQIAVRQVPFSATAKNTVTINGGTFTGETAGLQMFNINNDAKLSETIIKGGTFNGTYAFYTSFRSAQASELATINIEGGTFNGYVYLFNAQNGSADYPMTVAITDGLFNSGVYIYTNNANGNEVSIKAITGGIFSVDPSEYCAENYGAIELPDGTWFVRMLAGTQTREFANAGWYWFSSYIQDMEGQAGLETLKSELDGKGKEIKSQHEGTRYYKAYNSWTSGLTSLSTSEMYMINTTDPVTVEFNGDFVEYESRTINLVEGWNWIGYPVSQELDINIALKNHEAKDGDYIKGKNDGEDAWFFEGYGWWSKDEDFKFKPGHGYMYLSEQTTSFEFNAVGSEDVNTDLRRSVANNYHWNANATQYPYNMTMVAVVDGIADNEYEVAAFVNGEVRGSARPVYFEPLDAYILVLTIHGNEVEEMTFKYHDLSTNTEYELNNRINYSNNAIVGSIYEPYKLTRGTTGIGEAAISNINIYPNPTTTGTEINLQATCDKVEVFNALGVKVVEYHNVDSIDALETAGIYVIRITNNGNVQNCRLVVK